MVSAGRRQWRLQPLIERWDGKRWSMQATPALDGTSNSLSAVSCSSNIACTAVGGNGGEPLAERWNGINWSIQATPRYAEPLFTSGLAGVSCPTSTTCLAVAATTGQAIQTLALRWDGGSWTRETTSAPDGNDSGGSALNAVSCTSTVICTAVGWGDRWYTGLAEQRASSSSSRFTVSDIRTFADGTVRFRIAVPEPGSIEVLETAWNSNLAHAASLLLPAAKRFVFAHENLQAGRAGTIFIEISPGSRGRQLVAHHRYRVVLRLWVAYTPVDGRTRQAGFPGLHLPHGHY